jgi:hypothetical protein
MSPLPVSMRFNSSRQDSISSLEGILIALALGNFCPTIICFLLQYAISQDHSASTWVVKAFSSSFLDLVTSVLKNSMKKSGSNILKSIEGL